MNRFKNFFAAALSAAALIAGPALAQSDNENTDYKRPAAEIVEAATKAVQRLSERPKFAELARDAQALVIFPDVVRAGFLVTGQAGSGVLIKRRADGTWSAPAFYGLESAGLGLQAGVEVSNIGILVMNKAALTPFYSGGIDLGVGAGFAVATLSRALDAEVTPDLVTFTTSKGAFAGVSVKGTNFRPQLDRNEELYGRKLNTQQVNDDTALSGPGVKALQAALNAL